MRTWVYNTWDGLLRSFWFVPGGMLLSSVVLAIVMVEVDLNFPIKPFGKAAWLMITAEAARTILGALFGALVTVAGVTFSLTMLTLSQTTTQFGPRLIRNFMNQNVAQVTLGFLLGTSIYSLIILRSIRVGSDGKNTLNEFIPNYSILLGEVLGALSLVIIIWFVHRLSLSLQAERVVKNVYDDLITTIERNHPDNLDEKPTADLNAWHRRFTRENSMQILAKTDGYLQGISYTNVVDQAVKAEGEFLIVAVPGNFIVQGDVLVLGHVKKTTADGDPVEESVREQFLYGTLRTPRQDVECALRELVEIGVRALSPGINDPYTAILCIDYVQAALTQLVRRPWPMPAYLDDDKKVRVVASQRDFNEMLATACDTLREAGKSTAIVQKRLARMLANLLDRVHRDDDRAVLQDQLDRVTAAAKKHLLDQTAINEVLKISEMRSNLPNEPELG